MPRHAVAALAVVLLSAAAAGPSMAQDAPNPLGENWNALMTATGNVRNSIIALATENAALQQQVTALRAKCGAPCEKQPSATPQSEQSADHPATASPAQPAAKK